MDTLTERQQAILGFVISEYVATAVPVGSDTIVRKYGPGVSSATVRSIFAVLESTGYIYHPHTSAGRVPSDKGYRFYVEKLMPRIDLSADERRTISHQFHQIERDLDQWVQLAVTVIARVTQCASVVTLPVVPVCRLKHLELVAVQERATLLIVLLQEGVVRQQLLATTEPSLEEDLDRVARRLSGLYRGQVAQQIARTSVVLSGLEKSVSEAIVTLMRRVDQQAFQNVWYDGVSFILRAPEFSRAEKVSDLIEAVEQRQVLREISSSALDTDGIQIVIGEENVLPSLRDCAVVAARYGPRGDAAGVIGVVGPTRMRYDRAVGSLQYISGLLSDLWEDLTG